MKYYAYQKAQSFQIRNKQKSLAWVVNLRELCCSGQEGPDVVGKFQFPPFSTFKEIATLLSPALFSPFISFHLIIWFGQQLLKSGPRFYMVSLQSPRSWRTVLPCLPDTPTTVSTFPCILTVEFTFTIFLFKIYWWVPCSWASQVTQG